MTYRGCITFRKNQFRMLVCVYCHRLQLVWGKPVLLVKFVKYNIVNKNTTWLLLNSKLVRNVSFYFLAMSTSEGIHPQMAQSQFFELPKVQLDLINQQNICLFLTPISRTKLTTWWLESSYCWNKLCIVCNNWKNAFLAYSSDSSFLYCPNILFVIMNDKIQTF